MGTNYYLKKQICPTCEHSKEETHIGKSSYGWEFSFHSPSKAIESTKAWEKEIKNGKIFTEYEEELTEKAFWKMVKEKKGGLNHTTMCREKYSEYDDTFLDEEGNSFSRGEFC